MIELCTLICFQGCELEVECFDLAIKEVKVLSPDDEVFLIRDLFKGDEWNKLATGKRRVPGSLFLKKSKRRIKRSCSVLQKE